MNKRPGLRRIVRINAIPGLRSLMRTMARLKDELESASDPLVRKRLMREIVNLRERIVALIKAYTEGDPLGVSREDLATLVG